MSSFSTPFVVKTIFSPLRIFDTLVKDHWTYMHVCVFFMNSLVCSIGLYICLDARNILFLIWFLPYFVIRLEVRKCKASNFVYFSKYFFLSIQHHLYHMNFRIFFACKIDFNRDFTASCLWSYKQFNNIKASNS